MDRWDGLGLAMEPEWTVHRLLRRRAPDVDAEGVTAAPRHLRVIGQICSDLASRVELFGNSRAALWRSDLLLVHSSRPSSPA